MTKITHSLKYSFVIGLMVLVLLLLTDTNSSSTSAQSVATQTPDVVATYVAATMNALQPSTPTPDIIATGVAATLSALQPATATATLTATPDAIATAVAGTVGALQPNAVSPAVTLDTPATPTATLIETVMPSSTAARATRTRVPTYTPRPTQPSTYTPMPGGAPVGIPIPDAEIFQIALGPDNSWIVLFAGNDGRSHYMYQGIPQAMEQTLSDHVLDSGGGISRVAFTPDGGWVIIFNWNGYSFRGIPEGAADAIREANDRQDGIMDIAFGPNDSWILTYQDSNGSIGSSWQGIPSGMADDLHETYDANWGVNSAVFSGRNWLYIYGGNGFEQSLGIPDMLNQRLGELNDENYAIKSVSISPDNPESWAVAFGMNGWRLSSERPVDLLRVLAVITGTNTTVGTAEAFVNNFYSEYLRRYQNMDNNITSWAAEAYDSVFERRSRANDPLCLFESVWPPSEIVAYQWSYNGARTSADVYMVYTNPNSPTGMYTFSVEVSKSGTQGAWLIEDINCDRLPESVSAQSVQPTATRVVSTLRPTATRRAPTAVPTFAQPVCTTSRLQIGCPAEVYTTDGDGLRLRALPSTSGEVRRRMPSGTEVYIMDGPFRANGYTWWEVYAPPGIVGYAVESADGIRTLIPIR